MAESTFIPFASSHEAPVKEFKVADSPPLLSKFADKFIVEGGGRRPTTAATVAMVLLNTALHRSDILEQKIPGEALGGQRNAI